MTFKIVSVGWQCAGFWERTVASIESQSLQDWDVSIVYDPGDDEGTKIKQWCADHGPRWHCTVNTERRHAVRNQVDAIQALDPQDEDVVVFLDLDGDQFAHADVLFNLERYYADGTLVTYGSYRPIPPVNTCTPAKPFPPEVVRARSYRQWIRAGNASFNHLRTMKGKIATAIPINQFKWQSGEWYQAGTDYIFMTAALELANGRYKCIDEVLVLYNHANPRADYIMNATLTPACTEDYLSRPPLSPLEEI